MHFCSINNYREVVRQYPWRKLTKARTYCLSFIKQIINCFFVEWLPIALLQVLRCMSCLSFGLASVAVSLVLRLSQGYLEVGFLGGLPISTLQFFLLLLLESKSFLIRKVQQTYEGRLYRHIAGVHDSLVEVQVVHQSAHCHIIQTICFFG